MSSQNLKAVPLASASRHYQLWLQKQPLSDQSKRAYISRVNQFLGFLDTSGCTLESLFKNPKESEYILREYKRHLKRSRKFLPSSVNAALTGIDHFYQYMGMQPAKIVREDLPQEAPKALTPDEQKRFVSAAHARRALDKAVTLLLIYTGIRIGECAALDMADLSVTGRKSQVIVRSGKGERYREVPLNEDAREALRDWIFERNQRFAGKETADALFLNPQGSRLSTSSLDRIVRKTGEACGLEISAHVLRHTFLTKLVRKKYDLILVADLAGHRRLETTRRYALPTRRDKQSAVDSLLD
jgi:site-specific recombinase XerD